MGEKSIINYVAEMLKTVFNIKEKAFQKNLTVHSKLD